MSLVVVLGNRDVVDIYIFQGGYFMSLTAIGTQFGASATSIQQQMSELAGSVTGDDLGQLMQAQTVLAVLTQAMSFLAKVLQEIISGTKQAQQTSQQG